MPFGGPAPYYIIGPTFIGERKRGNGPGQTRFAVLNIGSFEGGPCRG